MKLTIEIKQLNGAQPYNIANTAAPGFYTDGAGVWTMQNSIATHIAPLVALQQLGTQQAESAPQAAQGVSEDTLLRAIAISAKPELSVQLLAGAKA
jgi:predicted RNase H-like nuclease